MATRHRSIPRVLAGVASAIVLIFTGLAGAGAVAFRSLDNNITTQTLAGIGTATPSAADFQPGEPLNILVMGSDNRSSLGTGDYGDPTEIEGARSDTTILVHIAADRQSALAVSIPRDTVVDIPSCPRFVDGPSMPVTDRFNEAFNIAGPVCTVKTVEKLTGAKVDHFVIVDFNGFKGVVDALDGVEVCLKQPVDDPLSGLKLPAGTSTVKGEDALAFVRARYTLGDGSDLGRIERQQAFLASALRKATSLGVLANPITTYRVLDEATKSLTTDESLSSLNDLTALALSLSDMKPSDVTFVTLPTFYNDDGATVSPDPALTAPLWQAIRNDTGWPPEPTVPPGSSSPLTVAPAEIQVRVLNGTGLEGEATKAAEQLTKNGYQVVEVGDFDISEQSTSSVLYPPGFTEAGRTLAYATGAKDMGEDYANDGSEVLTLVVGDDFSTVRPVIAAPAASASPSASATPEPGTEPSPTPSQNLDGTSGDILVCS
ncbi:MAG: LytR family transcriptional regulator [Actinomycetota bacterium]|nr:LytR family transcriptional regulator [Actinomycetota bacterium]